MYLFQAGVLFSAKNVKFRAIWTTIGYFVRIKVKRGRALCIMFQTNNLIFQQCISYLTRQTGDTCWIISSFSGKFIDQRTNILMIMEVLFETVLLIYCLKHSGWKHKCNKIYSYHFITISKYNMGGGNLCFISQTFWSYKHVIILGKKLKWYQQADYSFLYSTGRGSMHSSSLFGFLIISPGIKGFFAQKT